MQRAPRTKVSSTFALVLSLGLSVLAAQPAGLPPRRLVLREQWRLQSSVLVQEPGEVVSTPCFQPEGWHSVTLPSTVLNALIKCGVYPDLRVGLNAFQIPDASDDFNRTRIRLHDDGPRPKPRPLAGRVDRLDRAG